MNATAFVELTLEKRGRQYFVLVIDRYEINEVGPFKTKRAAQNIYEQLAHKAQALGGMTASGQHA